MPQPGPSGGTLRPAHRSPEVLPDGRVRFRLLAPQAKSVALRGHFQLYERGPWPETHPGPIELERGSDELWFHETAPLEPGFYQYWFVVDGLPLLDPQNPLGSVAIYPTTVPRSYVDVPAAPGEPPALHQHRDGIPHGTVHCEVFYSRTFGRDVGCRIYTPPGYTAAGPTSAGGDQSGASGRPARPPWPVLYLLHGHGHDETSWCAHGRRGPGARQPH